MYRPSDILARAKRVHRAEGLLSLSRRAAMYLLSRLFEFDYQTYYLSVARTDDVPNRDDKDFMPRIDDFTIEDSQHKRGGL